MEDRLNLQFYLTEWPFFRVFFFNFHIKTNRMGYFLYYMNGVYFKYLTCWMTQQCYMLQCHTLTSFSKMICEQPVLFSVFLFSQINISKEGTIQYVLYHNYTLPGQRKAVLLISCSLIGLPAPSGERRWAPGDQIAGGISSCLLPGWYTAAVPLWFTWSK